MWNALLGVDVAGKPLIRTRQWLDSVRMPECP